MLSLLHGFTFSPKQCDDVLRVRGIVLRVILLLMSLTAMVPLRAAGADQPVHLDPFHFLAGISVVGAEMRYIDPPQCEAFFKDDRRAAEMFLEVAESWRKGRSASDDTRYHETEVRYVINDPGLSLALQAFYASPVNANDPSVDRIVWDPKHRLSFVAGIYARTFRNGEFHGRPSQAMYSTVVILLAEGCQVTNLTLSENAVPSTMHFRVNPSKHVAALFERIDAWQPRSVKWEAK